MKKPATRQVFFKANTEILFINKNIFIDKLYLLITWIYVYNIFIA